MNDLKVLAEAVIRGDGKTVKELTKRMIDSGVNPMQIINEGLIAGMNVVGIRFKAGDMYVPEVLMSAKAMNIGVELVKPLILETDMPSAGKVIMGTVRGDMHDIGKNLCIMLLESNGFKVIDLGVDVQPEAFVKAAKEHNAQVIGLSALLTTTMLNMKETLAVLEEEGIRDKVKVIIGGAPITQTFADQIGADGYAADAGSAVDLCKQLVG